VEEQQRQQKSSLGHGTNPPLPSLITLCVQQRHAATAAPSSSIYTMTSTMTSQDVMDFKNNNANTFAGDAPPVAILRKTSSVTSVRGVKPSTLEER